MKYYERLLTAGLLAICGHGELADAAGPPPLDRPSPPACCADGYCYPNRTTFGVYATRWRRWPVGELEPTPAEVTPGAPLGPEIPPFSLPPKEEEDRSAPPRTKAAERVAEEEEGGPETPPMPAPGTTPTGTPPGLDLPLPDDESTPTGTPWRPGDPLLDTPPTQTPPATGIPTGDLDPPPAPPFRAPSLVNSPTNRDSVRPAIRPPQRRVVPERRNPANDPPPAFPLTLADARA
jgi:hypothetical protein